MELILSPVYAIFIWNWSNDDFFYIYNFFYSLSFTAFLLLCCPCDTGKAEIFFTVEENKASATLLAFCLPTHPVSLA